MKENRVKGKVLLLVEDDEFLSDIYKMKFSQAGFEVCYAENGEVALQMAKQKHPDVILLDLMMPVKDGFETLKELKADPELKHIKVIVFSNLGQDKDMIEVMTLGASDYLVKSNISFDETVEKVQHSLRVV